MRKLIAAIVIHASAVLFSAGIIASMIGDAIGSPGADWGRIAFTASAIVLLAGIAIALSGGRPPGDGEPPRSGPVHQH